MLIALLVLFISALNFFSSIFYGFAYWLNTLEPCRHYPLAPPNCEPSGAVGPEGSVALALVMVASKFLAFPLRRLPAAAVLTLLSSTESLWSFEMVGFASKVENCSVLWLGPPWRLVLVLDQCMATASRTAILGCYFYRMRF